MSSKTIYILLFIVGTLVHNGLAEAFEDESWVLTKLKWYGNETIFFVIDIYRHHSIHNIVKKTI